MGERHLQYVGTFEGDFQSWSIHLECRRGVAECEPEDGMCMERHGRGKTCEESHR